MRRRRTASWHAIAWAYDQPGLSAPQRAVLLALAFHQNEFRDGVWPSQKRLAELTCFCPRTVWSALKVLEKRGLITRTARWRASEHRRDSDIIVLNLPDDVASKYGEKLIDPVDAWLEPTWVPPNGSAPARKGCEGTKSISSKKNENGYIAEDANRFETKDAIRKKIRGSLGEATEGPPS
jgi:hypothetical protein